MLIKTNGHNLKAQTPLQGPLRIYELCLPYKDHVPGGNEEVKSPLGRDKEGPLISVALPLAAK